MIETKKDGRTILKGKDYTLFRISLHAAQSGQCISCPRMTFLDHPIEWDDSFHVAHRGSRGLGSAIRDDVVGPKKGQVEGGKCGSCHRREHGQQ